MDHRIPLELHTVLAFEGMTCHIEEVIGQGTNAIVYKGWYQDSLNRELRHHVLVKELFPFHPEGVIGRAEDGHIVIKPEAEELGATHNNSFETGNIRYLDIRSNKAVFFKIIIKKNSTFWTTYGYIG